DHQPPNHPRQRGAGNPDAVHPANQSLRSNRMPLAFDIVRGKPALMFLRMISTSEIAPTTVTATLSGNASAGATSLTVTALTAAIPKNTVLTFSRAAGTPSTVKVVVTADADASDTTL